MTVRKLGCKDTAGKKDRRLRWYQWRLRSLFLLTFAVAIGVSWLAVTIRDQRKQKAAAEAIEKAGGIARCESTWLGKLLSDRSLGSVWCASFSGETTADDAIKHLQGLSDLQFLVVSHTRVTDAGLAHLQRLNRLEMLWLDGNKLTGSGLVHLQGLPRLGFLSLKDTQVNDAALLHLQGLRQLLWLDLRGTKVTDKGLDDLQRALPRCTIERTWSKSGD
jgi:hypothetical protein